MLKFVDMEEKARSLGLDLSRNGGRGYILLKPGSDWSCEFSVLSSVDKYLTELEPKVVAELSSTWVHVMLTATDAEGVLDRRRCLESRSNRRAAKKAMFRAAKEQGFQGFLGIIPGLGNEYEAPRKGGGVVRLAVVDCAGVGSGCGGECQGECQGERIVAPVRLPGPEPDWVRRREAAAALAAQLAVLGGRRG